MSVDRTVPIEILLVEDSESDVALTREALKDAEVVNNLSVARDGRQAMAMIRGEGGHEGRPRPDVIVLDLNLPVMDGREVLAELKADPELKLIPVVVLTTSTDERDVMAASEQFVNAYITKPVGLDQFIAAIKAIEEFWLKAVKRSPGSPETPRA